MFGRIARLFTALLAMAAAGFFAVLGPARAIYDPLSFPNNRFGIHILEPAEVEKAAELVNSSGGAWGYVTIPIRANDRDLEKWNKFMADCRRRQVIPILRIASFPVDPPDGKASHWMAPNEYDLVDFANFLNELSWPTANRYVIVYNEPNHESEWGGFVYPEEYARVLDRAIDIFHKKNSDFFVIAAGMDASAPDTASSLNEYEYFRRMEKAWPEVLSRADGLSFHAYGNPAFSSAPNIYSRVNVASYRYGLNYLHLKKPLFLTEAGWRADLTGEEAAAEYYREAFTHIWTEDYIVAVTPFLLDARSGPFVGFSFIGKEGNFKSFARELEKLPKTAGAPPISKGLPLGKESLVNFPPAESAIIQPWSGNWLRTFKNAWLAWWRAAVSAMFRRG